MIDLRRLREYLWAVMFAAVLAVATLNSRFLWQDIRGIFHRSIDHLGKQDFELYLHLTTAPLILILGAVVIHRTVRTRYPRLHRWGGRIYVAGVLVTSIATFRLSLNETEGPMTVVGFAALSLLWFGTALMGLTQALRGKYDSHSRWMIRNYALTLTNVTFRVEFHLLMWLGADFDTIYEPLRVLQLFPNLVVAEFLIRTGFFTSRTWRDYVSPLRELRIPRKRADLA